MAGASERATWQVNLIYARDHSVAESLEYQATWSAPLLQALLYIVRHNCVHYLAPLCKLLGIYCVHCQAEDLPKAFVASLKKTNAVYSKL